MRAMMIQLGLGKLQNRQLCIGRQAKMKGLGSDFASAEFLTKLDLANYKVGTYASQV